MQSEITAPPFEPATLAHDAAWAELSARYRPLLIQWAGRFRAGVSIAEFNEDIADQALARARAESHVAASIRVCYSPAPVVLGGSLIRSTAKPSILFRHASLTALRPRKECH